MSNISALRRGWRSLWEFRADRDVPLVARLLAASGVAVALALGLMSFVAIVGTVDRPGWWWASMLPTIGICLCIVHAMFAVLRLGALWLPSQLAERMSGVRDIRAGMALSALALAGIVLGMAIGFTAVPILGGFDLGRMFDSVPVAAAKFAVFLSFAMAANWAWWRARLRRQQLREEVTEARLRLLQGQIEPHLLFNTLANIQSLMDYDPPRAKRMLETFSGYLRTGLSQLRQADSTLEAELEMVHSYLSLLKIRMEERLDFHIDASEEARAARMPALMLQPLVENAIHHGLEPKLEGGTILVSATVQAGRLTVRIADDGVGLDAPRRRIRPGAGMALANLRARLQAQFGAEASLVLQGGNAGAEVVLDLPYQARATLPAPAQVAA